MKVCKKCGTVCEDRAMQCTKCGNGTFMTIEQAQEIVRRRKEQQAKQAQAQQKEANARTNPVNNSNNKVVAGNELDNSGAIEGMFNKDADKKASESVPVVSIGQWLLLWLCMTVPILNIVTVIRTLVSKKENKNKKNYVISYLIALAISIVISIVLAVLLHIGN